MVYHKVQFWDQYYFNVHKYKDLPNMTNKCNFTLFVDDTTLTFKSHNLYDLENEINSTLVLIYDWLCVNKLVLNIDNKN